MAAGVEEPASRGVLFLEQPGGMLITGDYWRIIIDVNVTKINEGISNLRLGVEGIGSSLQTIQRSDTAPGLEVLQRCVGLIKEVIEDMFETIGTLEEMLPSGRNKRGLINAGGKVIKVLFGNPDADDLEEVHEKLVKLGRQAAETIYLQADLITVTRTLSRQTEANSKQIQQLAENVASALKPITTKIRNLERLAQGNNLTLHMFMNSSVIIGNLQLAVLKGLVELRNLVLSLQNVNVGNGLVASLISPLELSTIVKRVQISLPRGVELVTGTSPAEMYMYYSIAKVSAHSIGHSIRVFVDLPLASQGHMFKVFHVKTIPVTDPVSNISILYRINDEVFIISQNRELHGVMSRNELANCVGETPMVCPAEVQLYYRRQPTCSSSQYNGNAEDIERFCQRVVLAASPTPSWVWNRFEASWVYSLPAPEKLITECRIQDNVKVTETTIDGVGTLHVTQGCTYRTDRYVILPNTRGMTITDLQPKLLNITNLKVVLSSGKPVEEADDLSRAIEEIAAEGHAHPGPYGAELPFDYLLQRQKEYQQRRRVLTWTLGTAVGCVATMLSTFIAWKVYQRWRSTRTPVPPSATVDATAEYSSPTNGRVVFRLPVEERRRLQSAGEATSASAE